MFLRLPDWTRCSWKPTCDPREHKHRAFREAVGSGSKSKKFKTPIPQEVQQCPGLPFPSSFFFSPILSYPGRWTIPKVVAGQGSPGAQTQRGELPSTFSGTLALQRAPTLDIFLSLSSFNTGPHPILSSQVASRSQ